jgi:hypothetical protein
LTGPAAFLMDRNSGAAAALSLRCERRLVGRHGAAPCSAV